jgi:hypothetical protein
MTAGKNIGENACMRLTSADFSIVIAPILARSCIEAMRFSMWLFDTREIAQAEEFNKIRASQPALGGSS